MPLRVEILNTGSELLLGQVVNTHLAFLARELFPLGLRVQRQICVPDGEVIRDALLEAFSQADIVLVTGGLGPTSDDITREITATLLGLELELHPGVLKAIEERFARRGLVMHDRIRRQAQVPAGAEVLWNPNGTAPGLAIKTDVSPHLFLLPGPPRELHPMMRNEVVPRLRALVTDVLPEECRVFRLAGIGESQVEAAVGPALEAMAGLELGYCARAGEVDLRLIGTTAVLDAAETLVMQQLGEQIFSRDGSDLETTLVQLLQSRGETLAVAESCTGGFLAHRLTNVPGASSVFLSGAVTYSNAAKQTMLGVPQALMEQHGAVSEPVVRAMVEGTLAATGSTHAVATTGVAGPDGGTPDKPVGTVFVGIGTSGGSIHVERLLFSTDRETFKSMTSQMAMELLRRRLVDSPR